MAGLRFDGSARCNIEIALRQIETLYKQETEALGLTIVEWYMLRTLYEKNPQMASRLAEAVGWAPTSFTPILDKLQAKGFIERRSHPADRRAMRIYLTEKGKSFETQIKDGAESIENNLHQRFSNKEWQSFQQVIESLQLMTP